ncbi:SecY-interacting protein [Acerihabitans sp. TG2]|uniref:SecY-interacting protein n=1 Tax=Acerihabitans sp. TG2 TaxID=3096008 RepID=UPI002B22FC7F|nr:SecY-interacting protein [Acerihabitans sp. TG2]MEA9392494.1 SecY-interacting protein [Acerihabitans sp. TG2]
MDDQVSQALRVFTQRYIAYWQICTGHPPASKALFGVSSPCVVDEDEEQVYWLPRQPECELTLDGVERALELQLQPAAQAFYCSQLAGDMLVSFDGHPLELLQVWSETDAVRIQENLIGHLLMQRRLKLPPTLFIATTDAELSLVSLSNLTGEVLLEEIGRKTYSVLAPTLQDFLGRLEPRVL